MSARNSWKLAAVAVSCAALGAGASAIANAGASSGTSSASTGHVRVHARRGLLRRAVRGDIVVGTRAGFATVTFDRGIVKSISGQQLTLTEGSKTKVYKTVTLTIPSTAKVRDDGHASTLADVKPGQRAAVVTGPKRTWVIARTPHTP